MELLVFLQLSYAFYRFSGFNPNFCPTREGLVWPVNHLGVFVDDDLATLVITLVGLASQGRCLLPGLRVTLNDVLVNMNDSFHLVSFLV